MNVTTRLMNASKWLVWVIALFASAGGWGQSVFFSHLNTSNGLSDNNIKSLAIDKKGFLWIGTSNGLNVFDGYEITTYYKEQVGMPSDKVIQLLCDSRNRVWVGTPAGVSWIDEKRNFHRIILPGPIDTFDCSTILEIPLLGIILFTDKGQFHFNEKNKSWQRLDFGLQTIAYNKLLDASVFGDNIILYVTNEMVRLHDYSTRKILYEENFSSPIGACRAGAQQIAVASETGNIQVIDLNTKKTARSYQLETKINGKMISATLNAIRPGPGNSLIAASGMTGLFIIDSAGKVNSHMHDPLDVGSISANNNFRVLGGANGEVVAGAFTAGVSLFNTHYQGASYKKIFSDRQGHLFDNYVNRIAEDKQHIFWLAAYDRLIRWDRKTNQSDFYFYENRSDATGIRSLEIKTLCFDRQDRLWVSAIGEGVALFDEAGGRFRAITLDTTGLYREANKTVNGIILRKDGSVWICSDAGIYTADPLSLAVKSFREDHLLKRFAGARVQTLFEDSRGRLWIGTQRTGVYCYDERQNTLTNLTTANGMLSLNCHSFEEDRFGNIYAATPEGFNIIAQDGKISAYNKSNGLRYNRCDGFLRDDLGNIWIANNKCVIKFEPGTKKMQYFEENAGIGMEGFRIGSGFKSSTGELLWGRWSGVNFFYPSQLLDNMPLLQVSIYEASLRDSIIRVGANNHIDIPYRDNSISFHYTAVNLKGSKNIVYEYMLENLDVEWQKGSNIRQARYSSLRPGDYIFKVKASVDGINWIASGNEVSVHVSSPIWQRWWFITLGVILESLIIYGIFRFRNNRVRYKEKLKADYEKKLAEIEMKALRAQMNPHFIFNCLNSINRYIIKSDHATASLYLTRFAKLIRLILDNSNSKNVLLSNELEALKLYIDMELLRFDNKFTYEIKVADGVHKDVTEVPSLIIQPYVENAIWHGLLHKETGGHLSINVGMIDQNILQCVVEDNGIGREGSMLLKSKTPTKKSLGMKITEDRINMLNEYASIHASITVMDRREDGLGISGTRVVIRIPV